MLRQTDREIQNLITNSKGTIWYGMHFYPGVAEYEEPNIPPYRVFLNEDTIRAMDPTFAGRPVFVHHVDGVDQDVDELRKEADGWVIESFYNQADGKHWVKFIAVTERADEAIRRKRWCLSNSYFPRTFAKGGLWNGVSYSKEITGGEYEHLAIVPNPRYEESVVMSPEEFKKYNDEKFVELKRLSNSEREPMLKFFKKAKVENTGDLDAMSVVLPKSGKEIAITDLVAAADLAEQEKGKSKMANSDHLIEHEGKKYTLNEFMDKHKAVCDELEAMKKKNLDSPDEDSDPNHGKVDMETKDKMNDGDETEFEPGGMPEQVAGTNADDDDSKEMQLEEHKDKEIEAAKAKKNEIEAAAKKKAEAKAKADRLRNANLNQPEVARVEFSTDQVARGKSRYGS